MHDARNDDGPAAPGPIVVINPNSSASVTSAIARALEGIGGGPGFDCRTIAEGPATIVSDADVAEAGERVAALAASLGQPAAVIIACFSDPGLAATRARLGCPVVGVQEAAVETALGLGDTFGIIALSPAPVPRHHSVLTEMGVIDRLAREVALSGVSAHDAGHRDDIYPEIVAAGREIRAAGGASIILGCAGFGPRRGRLEADLGIPVIDPVLAGARIALARIGG